MALSLASMCVLLSVTCTSPSSILSSSTFTSPSGFSCSNIRGLGFSAAVSQLVSLKVEKSGSIERLILQFKGGAPKWSIQSTPSATFSPSFAANASLSGNNGILLQLYSSTAPNFIGKTDLLPKFPLIREVRELGPAQTDSVWAIGTSSAACMRVWEIDSLSLFFVDLVPNS